MGQFFSTNACTLLSPGRFFLLLLAPLSVWALQIKKIKIKTQQNRTSQRRRQIYLSHRPRQPVYAPISSDLLQIWSYAFSTNHFNWQFLWLLLCNFPHKIHYLNRWPISDTSATNAHTPFGRFRSSMAY